MSRSESGDGWQRDHDGGTKAFLRVDLDGAFVVFDDTLGKGEANAVALNTVGVAATVKGLEDE